MRLNPLVPTLVEPRPARTAGELGHYIVADPKVCHGRVTFRGTRIFVQDVLELVAQGTDWDEICREFHGHISHEAIAEAVQLAGKSWLTDDGRLARRRNG